MRIHLILIGLMGALLAGISSDALAQSRSAIGQERLQVALANIHKARCEGGRRCAPATAAEFANPPLTDAQAWNTFYNGMTSALGQICGMNWRRINFQPMMAYWRHTMGKNERQMALFGLLHGMGYSVTMHMKRLMPREKAGCPPGVRSDMQTALNFKP